MGESQGLHIRVERLGGVQRMTLNRPGKRKARFELQHELVGEIMSAERSDDVPCIVPSQSAGVKAAFAEREAAFQ